MGQFVPQGSNCLGFLIRLEENCSKFTEFYISAGALSFNMKLISDFRPAWFPLWETSIGNKHTLNTAISELCKK